MEVFVPQRDYVLHGTEELFSFSSDCTDYQRNLHIHKQISVAKCSGIGEPILDGSHDTTLMCWSRPALRKAVVVVVQQLPDGIDHARDIPKFEADPSKILELSHIPEGAPFVW